jgi:nitrogen regulatory protein PII
MIRKKDSETNSFIQSEMVEIVIKSQDEEEVIELINEMVQSQIKVNIETIEEI